MHVTAFGNRGEAEMPESRPDGLDIEITRLCRYGNQGEHKTISYSTAAQLIALGLAKEYKHLPGTEVSFAPALVASDQTSKVTAVCPTYNRKKYLPSVIACFLSQTYRNS